VGPSNVAKFLWLLGVLCPVIGWLLFLRMAITLNKEAPPDRRILLRSLDIHYLSAIIRPHEEWFPTSSVRTAWLVVMVVSTSLMAIAIILAIRPVR